MAALFEGGAEAATVLSRQRGVRRFSAWLADDTGQARPARPDEAPEAGREDPARSSRRTRWPRCSATCRTRTLPRPAGPGHHHPDGRVDGAAPRSCWTMKRGRRERRASGRPWSSAARAARAGSPRSPRARPGTLTATSGRRPPTGSRASRGCGSRSSAAKEPRLTYGGLYTALRRRALRADPPFRLHPHMLRAHRGDRVPSQGRPGHVPDGPGRLVGHLHGAAVHQGCRERAGDRGSPSPLRWRVIGRLFGISCDIRSRTEIKHCDPAQHFTALHPAGL